MKKQNSLHSFLKFIDIALILYIFISVRAYFATGVLLGLDAFLDLRESIQNSIVLMMLALIWVAIFKRMDLYPKNIKLDRLQWMRRLPAAVSAGAAVYLAGVHFFNITRFKTIPACSFWIIMLAAFFIYRGLIFGLQSWFEKRLIRHVLIVGVNTRSIDMYQKLKGPQMILQFFDFGENPDVIKKVGQMEAPVKLGTLADFNYDISNQPLDEVIIALPIRSHYDLIQKIIDLCSRQGVSVQLAANIFNLQKNVHQLVAPASNLPLIYYETRRYSRLQYDFKRLIDIIGSLTGMTLLLPLYLIIALLIAVDDGFPIFYLQDRIGLNKKRFRIFKFRTMVRGADRMMDGLEDQNEYQGGPAFKMTHDPRVIRIGHWLRRASLDELPQLLNVFLGSMSLVGPRPLPVRDFERFYDDRHRLRFSVKPGITGLWQISGRNIIKFEEWMGLDIEYAQNWNLLLDVKILFYTIPVVLSGKGAK